MLASFRSFEEINAWKEARELVSLIYKYSKHENFKNDFGFKDQITRASISIMNNIAEGFERQNKKEFIRFLLIAKGSAGEIRSMLYLTLDLNYISPKDYNLANNLVVSIIKKLSSLINYLQNQIGISSVREEQEEYNTFKTLNP